VDPDRARKLSALIWRDRLKAALPIIVTILIVVSLGLALTIHQTPAEREQLEGQVVSWTRAQTEEGAGTYYIGVTLADGEKVTATASRHGRSPRIGEQINVDKVTTVTGATRYQWNRR
jgi:hypothetical protein